MLSELYIVNLAVIQEANIPFSGQFNVFTGETGAGKSILINGINAVLGQRTSKDIVRSGCDKAVVTAMFRQLFPATKKKLDEYGIDYSDDELTITREIFADGGSTARINSKPANISVIRDIGETLVNIHGQHDNQILLSPEKHLYILDGYAELESEIDAYRAEFKQLQELSRTIKALKLNEKDRAERIELLKQKIEDIAELEIEEDEDIAVEEEYKIAKNSVDIHNALSQAIDLINGNESDAGIVEQVGSASDRIGEYTELLSELNPITERLNNVKLELDDICSEIIKINDKAEIDPQRYEYLLERRHKLFEIKKKYGPNLSDVLNVYNSSVKELEALADSTGNIQKLLDEREKLLKDVSQKADKLSEKRKKAAEKLAHQVQEELKFLDMPNVRLEVAFTEGKLTAVGMDTVEFLISANIGEPPKPINKIASGGELSRIMLALKNVIAEKDEVPTLIFDEIDTGVSGRAAQKIGIKLAQISKIRQVICVTHLSQLAVMADNHLLIEKTLRDNRTFTNVKKLSFDERKHEIARILCGESITETALKNAEEMLNSKNNFAF